MWNSQEGCFFFSDANSTRAKVIVKYTFSFGSYKCKDEKNAVKKG